MTVGEKEEHGERRAERRKERDLHEPSRDRHEGETGKVGHAQLAVQRRQDGQPDEHRGYLVGETERVLGSLGREECANGAHPYRAQHDRHEDEVVLGLCLFVVSPDGDHDDPHADRGRRDGQSARCDAGYGAVTARSS